MKRSPYSTGGTAEIMCCGSRVSERRARERTYSVVFEALEEVLDALHKRVGRKNIDDSLRAPSVR